MYTWLWIVLHDGPYELDRYLSFCDYIAMMVKFVIEAGVNLDYDISGQRFLYVQYFCLS